MTLNLTCRVMFECIGTVDTVDKMYIVIVW